MSLQNLDLNLLKVLDALMDERSVTRAAHRLGRSQPAVSNALSRLRHLLRDDLFVREPGGLVLTPRAERLRQPVRNLIGLAESCFFEQDAFDPASAAGVFRIAMPDRLSVPVSPLLLERLSRLAPNITLHVRTADRSQAVQLLAEDKVEMALGRLDDLPGFLASQNLLEEAFYCLLRRDHPALGRTGRLSRTALFEFPHVVVSATGEMSAIYDDRLSALGLARKVKVAVSNFSTVPLLLAESDMIGVFTRLITGVFVKSFDLARVPEPVRVDTITSSMVWHVRHNSDPRHAWFRDQLAAVCASLNRTNMDVVAPKEVST